MEEYFEGLRKIRKKKATIKLLLWPFICTFLAVSLVSIALRPMFAIKVLLIAFGYFIYLRFAFSKCPKCHQKYFSVFNILSCYCYFLDFFASQCTNCGLKMSELPEVDEYKAQRNSKEWEK